MVYETGRYRNFALPIGLFRGILSNLGITANSPSSSEALNIHGPFC